MTRQVKWLLMLLLVNITGFSLAAPAAADVSFPIDSAIYSGQFSDTINADKTISHRSFVGMDSTAELVVTGTSLTVACRAANYDVAEAQVDGGDWFDITPPVLNEDVKMIIFRGLADAPHHLTIRGKSPHLFLINNAAPGSFTVTGKAPAIKPPDTAVGNQYVLGATAPDALGRPGILNNIQLEALYGPRNFVGYDLLQQMYRGMGSDNAYREVPGGALFRFKGRMGGLAIWTYLDESRYAVVVDGVTQPPVQAPGTNRWGWLTLSTTLDAAATHEYGVLTALTNPAGYNLGSGGVYALRTRGGTGVDTTTQPPVRQLLACYGDSITASQIPRGSDFTSSWMYQLGQSLDMSTANLGVSSTTVHNYGTNLGKAADNLHPLMTVLTGEARTNNVTDLKPDKVVILYGTNDAAQVWVPYGGPGETLAQFEASYRNMLKKLLADLPATTEIYCVGILPRVDLDAATLAPWREVIRTSVAAVGGPRTRYIDPIPWQMDGPEAKDYTTNFSDGVHLNAAGMAALAEQLIRVMAPTATTSKQNQK